MLHHETSNPSSTKVQSYHLQHRLSCLNQNFRLGFCLKPEQGSPEQPHHADAEAWVRVNRRLSRLLRIDPHAVFTALDTYESWARKEEKHVNWVHKKGTDAQLLGTPHAHIARLEKLLSHSLRRASKSATMRDTRMGRGHTDLLPMQSSPASEHRISYPTLPLLDMSSSQRSVQRPDDRDSNTLKNTSRAPLDVPAPSAAAKTLKYPLIKCDPDDEVIFLSSKKRPSPDNEPGFRLHKSARMAPIRRVPSTGSRRSALNAVPSAGLEAVSFSTEATDDLGLQVFDPADPTSSQETPSSTLDSNRSQPGGLKATFPRSSKAHQRVDQDKPHGEARKQSVVPASQKPRKGSEAIAVDRHVDSRLSFSQQSRYSGTGLTQVSSTWENDAIEVTKSFESAQDPEASSAGSICRPRGSLRRDPKPGSSFERNADLNMIPRTSQNQFLPVERAAWDFGETLTSATQSTESTLMTRPSQNAISCTPTFAQDEPHIDPSMFNGDCDPFSGAKVQTQHRNLSLRTVYEATRVALATHRNPEDLVKLLEQGDDDNYNKLWNKLVSRGGESNVLRCSPVAWAAAGTFDSVALSGKLDLREWVSHPGRPKRPIFRFTLSPLRKERTLHRMARKYGADRLFTLEVPDFSKDSPDVWSAFIRWLVRGKHRFLGRVWRAFFVKQGEQRKERRKAGLLYSYSVNMFAVSGTNIKTISRNEAVRWLLYLRRNRDQKALKLFSRIGLSLSTTHAGIPFEIDQVVYTVDAYSGCCGRRKLADDLKSQELKHNHPKNASVMNDGCGRISFSAAQKIARALKLEPIPTAFQGRIGGAKGIWLVDRLNEELQSGGGNSDVWIEITESQLKYQVATSDKHRDELHYTFDVHSYSHALKPHCLNQTLIPILSDRNVRDSVFSELLEMDIDREATEMQQAMEKGGELLLAWAFKNQPIIQERTSAGELTMSGGFPTSRAEELIALVQSGHHPLRDHVLFSTCKHFVERHCKTLEQRRTIQIPRSTFALMVPDPFAVLNEGEIHVGFSEPFLDPITGLLNDHPALPGKASQVPGLVTRFPANLPSDIQKVQIVYHSELEPYKDVVFFSVKGKRSLADLLSGGDFDGDKAFVCWEPLLVDDFWNDEEVGSPIAAKDLAESLGIETDNIRAAEILNRPKRDGKNPGIDAFLEKGFEFNMTPRMLGKVSNYYTALNYHKNSIRKHLEIGRLLGLLVDAPKQGFRFDVDDWRAFLRARKLPERYETPYYKAATEEEQEDGKASLPTNHILDRLCLEVKKVCQRKIADLFDNLGQQHKPSEYNILYASIYERENKRAVAALKKRKHVPLQAAIIKALDPTAPGEILEDPGLHLLIIRTKLEVDLDNLVTWFIKESDTVKQAESRRGLDRIRGGPRAYQSLLIEARKRFLRIEPANVDCDMSDRWREDCSPDNEKVSSTTGSWTKLKASMLYWKQRSRRIPWLIAGIELCGMKAASSDPASLMVVSRARYVLTPDKRILRNLQNHIIAPIITEDESRLPTEDLVQPEETIEDMMELDF